MQGLGGAEEASEHASKVWAISRFIWDEKQIQSGNRDYMIGILEDLHRISDGYSSKSAAQLKPYIGNISMQAPQASESIYVSEKKKCMCWPGMPFKSNDIILPYLK
jgi:hypothetical protein